MIGIRGDKVTDIGSARDRHTRSRRAEFLADRLEEGAARLAKYAGRLSSIEWSTPMIEAGTRARTAGVIIHHVASIYPIELSVARTIASGKTVTDVTWDAVAEINARHAVDNANVSQAEAVQLLLKNSKEAADAIRTLSDDELDRAAPFSLSVGAPMTTQFVLEDHAVPHSWHHLARLRMQFGHRTVNP